MRRRVCRRSVLQSSSLLSRRRLRGTSLIIKVLLACTADPDISDVPAIREAFANCGKGGKIVFSEGSTYAINDLLEMEGCDQCIVEWDGVLKQSANISRILETQVFYTFQNKSTNIQLKGAKGAYIHSPAGTGALDGTSQSGPSHDLYVCASADLLPIVSPQAKARSGGRPTRMTLISTRAPSDDRELRCSRSSARARSS